IHNEEVYGQSFGVSSGFYKYSPFALLPFIPLAVLKYEIASVIFYLLIAVTTIWWSLYLVYYLEKKDQPIARYRGWILLVIALFMADHIERELHLGNVNLFLLIAAFAIFDLASRRRSVPAGILYGIILLFKPHFLILLPYFLWKKQWKLTAASVMTICAGLLAPVLFKGWTENLDLHHQ